MRVHNAFYLVIISTSSFLTVESANAAQLYNFSILGGLGSGQGGAFARSPGVLDLNENGEYVGRFVNPLLESPNNMFAFSSTGGAANFGALEKKGSQALGLNNQNEVVGQQKEQGFRTTPNGRISTASAIDKALVGFDINDRGDVVGLGMNRQAFRLLNGGDFEDITSIPGVGVAYDINENGSTVGRDVQKAFYYDGDLHQLGTLKGDRGVSRAREVNDFDGTSFEEFVGRATPKNATTDNESQLWHAFYGQKIGSDFTGNPLFSELFDLGTLCSDDTLCKSDAFDINRNFISNFGRGKIVGQSETDSREQHAFVIFDEINTNFKMFDLNNLIEEDDQDFYTSFGIPAFTLMRATSINDNGEIVGEAMLKFDKEVTYESGRVVSGRGGNIFGYRLTPISDTDFPLTSIPLSISDKDFPLVDANLSITDTDLLPTDTNFSIIPTSSSKPVPEPSTILGLSFALGIGALLRKRALFKNRVFWVTNANQTKLT